MTKEIKRRGRMFDRRIRVTGALIALNCLAFFIVELIGGSTLDSTVLIRWGGASVRLIQKGEYYRLLTSIFLHAGIRHLLNNMVVLYVIGTALEKVLKPVRYGIVYMAGGICSSICSYLYYLKMGEDVDAVGASGAIFAVLGCMLYVVLRNRGKVEGITLMQMIVMLGLSLYLGLMSPGVGNAAHISGLISGFVLGIILYRKRKLPRSTADDPFEVS
jgi:rhomboid protease GluP